MTTKLAEELPPIGAQLIVFGSRYPIEENFQRIVRGLAESGFVATEGGLADAAATKRILDAHGMRLGGRHANPKALRDNLPDIVTYLHALGASDVCNSGLIDWNTRTHEATLETARLLNAAGRDLKKEGIALHYHNHEFEFATTFVEAGGRTMLDVLLDELDPAAVDLCVDVAWVYRGGLDPIEFLATHAERTGYIHLKDWDGQKWTELGKGLVPVQACLEEIARNKRVRWVMWEEDVSVIDPFEAARESGAYLRSIGALRKSM